MSVISIQPADAAPRPDPLAGAAANFAPGFQSPGVDDFAQLLAARLPGSAGGEGAEALASLSPFSTGAEGASGLGLDNTFALLNQTLMLQLLTRVEELLGEPEAAEAVEESALAPDGMPVAGPISQHYHNGHQAVDIAVPVGTPVRSTSAGQVVYAGWNNQGYGNLVIVQNGAQRTYYAHLDTIPVAYGDNVQTGALIGYSGNTGNSTGPHLHYEVRVNGTKVRPEFDEHDLG